ncbi:5-(carboxyamino)imidazole ribonucleotide synthase [Benzoatithermus flavus]|uniref:N5-carboxyaminoimidazole ribonucleotide synthase n=1 Tax=Benzoatithermus flavus TaxID=3108223 RepID=A0ABU8XXZ4_9PROT
MIPPGSTIGILGGGQLGRMTAMAAARLGYRCHIFAPEAESPAADVAAAFTCAPYEDEAALAAFAAAVDVVTLEFENVPVSAVERLARERPVRPGARVLRITQDRLAEKDFVRGLGIPVTRYARVGSPADLAAARERLGHGVLKTTRLGYDGKGQLRVTAETDPEAAFARLGQPVLIHEAWVDFALELSVVTARNSKGQQASYVPVENRHRHHILDVTIAPAPLPETLAARAVGIAERIAQALGLEGLLAVEMFLTRSGELLVNELAPRPHNSGHWTIDACAVSQFEQHVRAVCDLPLGDPTRFADAEMQNLIGHDVDHWPELLAEPGARLHLYGKRETREGRKMGHVTRLKR